ncbi:MAG: thiamine-phosphate kinase [Spirochaetaceae bacterium]|nr:MAG: thiamine-phosphate kinase [Spirochaetaceae bacterium]
MTIKEIGGEFEMLSRLTRQYPQAPGLVKGIGDDCAVLDYNEEQYLLVTTDMMVENDHFSMKWQSPQQIGKKLVESNVSDIVCKGGNPGFAFLSMCLPKSVTYEFMEDFYAGVYHAAERHNVILAGGDTTHGDIFVFNLALTGLVKKDSLKLRSGARIGDAICVTGELGGSTAGLKLLLHGKNGFLNDYLEPLCRTADEGATIAKYATATIDVSDGLGSEVTHICEQSRVSAVIDYAAIPLSPATISSGSLLGLDPHDFALYGGEDYEIVFTITEKSIPELKKEFDDFRVVGKILDPAEGIHIFRDGKKFPVKKGYDHFSL